MLLVAPFQDTASANQYVQIPATSHEVVLDLTSASGFHIVSDQEKLDHQYDEMMTKLHAEQQARAERLAAELAVQKAEEARQAEIAAERQAVQVQATPIAPVRVAGTDSWAALRNCEAGGNYATNTGNGFYGAYQFDIGTWNGYGGYRLPSDAPPAVQDQKAQMTQAARGWSPWPSCSRQLGL